MAWDLSCRDWESRLLAGRSIIPNLPLDLVAGERAVRVFNKLRISDMPGTPTMEEAGGDWFRDIVRALFGSQDPQTRERMIREVFALVPKKNFKTGHSALLMVTALLLNERPNGKMIMTAPVQDVAEIAFEAAAGAIRLDRVLTQKLYIRDHLKTIVHRQSGAELKIMTFDPASLTGQKPIALLIDELHVVAKMNKAASSIRQLRGGMLPFPEAFMMFITTQSEEPPAGVFAAELQKARDIRDGKRDGVMLPVLYEFPREMQANRGQEPGEWADPGNWHCVNPNAGRSINIPRLVQEYETAKDTSDQELRAWASQHLNVEIGIALQSKDWVGATYWEACADTTLTLEDLLARSEVVTMGIDGGGLDDLLGACVIGREATPFDDGLAEGDPLKISIGKWLIWTKAWAHPIVLERRKSEASRFEDFKNDGDLVFVEHIGDDVRQVADIAEQCEMSGLLDMIGVDAAGIGAIVDEIRAREIAHDRVVAINQGWKMMGAIKTTERRLAEGAIAHSGSRMMNWCVGNAKVEAKGNAVVITKQLAGAAKIDPLMAVFDAVSLMMLNPKPRAKKFQMMIF